MSYKKNYSEFDPSEMRSELILRPWRKFFDKVIRWALIISITVAVTTIILSFIYSYFYPPRSELSLMRAKMAYAEMVQEAKSRSHPLFIAAK